jgi:hypothetical protein
LNIKEAEQDDVEVLGNWHGKTPDVVNGPSHDGAGDRQLPGV